MADDLRSDELGSAQDPQGGRGESLDRGPDTRRSYDPASLSGEDQPSATPPSGERQGREGASDDEMSDRAAGGTRAAPGASESGSVEGRAADAEPARGPTEPQEPRRSHTGPEVEEHMEKQRTRARETREEDDPREDRTLMDRVQEAWERLQDEE